MRGLVIVVGCVTLVGAVGAEPRGPTRWQEAATGVGLTRVWGSGNDLYGVGATGAFHSIDRGANWKPVDGAGPANGVWGSGSDDVWIVRARTIHHSTDGGWTTQSLPMLSFGAVLEGMWGVGQERYVFGTDRGDGNPHGAILHSRDGGASWRSEVVPDIERVAGMWGSAANDIYAVGAKGVVLHGTGDGTWRVARGPSSGSLEGVWGASANRIYAVGSGGTILFGDGKTWTSRASGVGYTLSSIVGLANEIYVGSADGAPLRSNDGVSWRPITALVTKGQVWVSDREHVVVAAASGVQFLGASEPVERGLVVTKLTDVEFARRGINRFDAYPAARRLMTIATNRVAVGSGPTAPSALGIEIDRVATCASPAPVHDFTASAGTELAVELTCTCDSKGTPIAAAAYATLWRDRKIAARFGARQVSDIEWCASYPADPAMQKLALAGLQSMILTALPNSLDQILASDLAIARLDEDKADAYARYVLDGGRSGRAYLELAQLIGRPFTWRGFFWNDPGAAPIAACADTATMLAAESKGDERATAGAYVDALHYYQMGVQCEPRMRLKAYAVACSAHEWTAAKGLFQRLPMSQQPAVVETCVKQGFDPR